MPKHTWICLFDLAAYDTRAAPALRAYAHRYDPAGVVELLREIMRILPDLRREPERPLLDLEEYEHWIDSLAPDAGNKPSDQTMREVADMIIQPLCIPHGTGLHPLVDIEKFVPYLSDRSAWFADLEQGGEELAGPRLEFTFGSGALVATKQQIAQFLEEVRRVPPPEGDLATDYQNLKSLLEKASYTRDYTVLKTSWKS
jgi:hypothetical protein